MAQFASSPESLIVALSGPVGAGKTKLAMTIQNEYQSITVRTRIVVEKDAAEGSEAHRRTLQRIGRELDFSTDGAWVAQAVARFLGSAPIVVVDAVRTTDQVNALRKIGHVLHVHVTGEVAELRARYAVRRRHSPAREFHTYGELLADGTEANVTSLSKLADIVIDTTKGRVADEALSQLFAEILRGTYTAKRDSFVPRADL